MKCPEYASKHEFFRKLKLLKRPLVTRLFAIRTAFMYVMTEQGTHEQAAHLQ
jgi:hypothetical protein